MGNYSLESADSSITAGYGLDDISLGFSNAVGGPTLKNQVLAGFASNANYLGSFGLNNQPTNFTDLTNSSQSFLTSLRAENLIPSLSWAYTAGAHYRKTASLLRPVFFINCVF